VIGGRWFAAFLLSGIPAMTNAAEVIVFAAGSLCAPFTEIAQAFERASGHKVVMTFGASGLLRDRIGSGERADVLASANLPINRRTPFAITAAESQRVWRVG
jgi:ABC-type molybdate transport system substrate-binding protein